MTHIRQAKIDDSKGISRQINIDLNHSKDILPVKAYKYYKQEADLSVIRANIKNLYFRSFVSLYNDVVNGFITGHHDSDEFIINYVTASDKDIKRKLIFYLKSHVKKNIKVKIDKKYDDYKAYIEAGFIPYKGILLLKVI